MENLQELYQIIDRLNRDELDQLAGYVDQLVEQRRSHIKNPQEKITALKEAVENFWEGVAPEKVDEIIEDMNSEDKPIP